MGFVGPFILFCLILVACYIVIRQQTSPLTTITQWIGDMAEGFQTVPKTSPKCPIGYKFFTNATGESLCCNGKVNPFTHTCSPVATADLYGGLCAFRPDVANPINPSTSLPLCSGVIEAVTHANGAAICPPSLPIYASSASQQSCCKTATNLDGTDCTPADLDANNFCRVSPTSAGKGGRDCAQMRTYETSGNCPAGLQKGMYKMGSTETSAYPAASGKSVPACFGIERSCFPDTVVSSLQSSGIFTSQPSDPKKWGYACSGYQKYYVDKDMSDPGFQKGYLTN